MFSFEIFVCLLILYVYCFDQYANISQHIELIKESQIITDEKFIEFGQVLLRFNQKVSVMETKLEEKDKQIRKLQAALGK